MKILQLCLYIFHLQNCIICHILRNVRFCTTLLKGTVNAISTFKENPQWKIINFQKENQEYFRSFSSEEG